MAENGKDGGGGGDAPPKKTSKKGGTEVEDIYQKVTQLEHVLLRPDTYIGSIEEVVGQMWVYDTEVHSMVQREIKYVPGLYKIFDEILVNAADNKQRDPTMDCIKIDIKPDKNQISVWNNGKGIPVVEHKDEKMFVPTMIFGHLLTSSNYNDEEAKVTGGRNGYGAKLCNIFSTKFTVETACKEYKKTFKQSWGSNMSRAGEPHISSYSGSDFTRVAFSPDLAKFNMTVLDKDIIDLMSRRAYDVAASTRGVKVFLNGERVKVKNFKEYIDLYLKDKKDGSDNPLKVVYEVVNDRWEVAMTISPSEKFQQVSFVNSIATTKGGRHVDHVVDSVVKELQNVIKKKNKGGDKIKPFQIKNYMWVFVNCLIVNPTFDSQTKETMTLAVKNFGSKCTLSPAFHTKVAKCGIVDQVLSWAKYKEKEKKDKTGGTKKSKLSGIPKLMDANDAGTFKSLDCTLILTEGDSAMTTAVGGLGIIGRDKYGAFPLRGKLLNVRDAAHKQIMDNAEINNIIKIMGLQYKRQYNTTEDLKSLRYGRMMIMTDQDQDGSHIKGLLINFIHTNWPSLLKIPFLEEFITPIVKASKGQREVHSFYSLPEFEEWKSAHANWPTYQIKYYKGLGTSTPKETKEYFSDMKRHRILFYHNGPDDDHHIKLAFSKSCVEQRKDWLTTWMDDSKRRRELGLKEEYLYLSTTTKVHYTDFINKELVLFSNADNERSIPSMVDGLKPGQRKVMFVCMQRNDKKEVKVAQLAGSVGEKSAYHHGEASLHSTIVHLAQNFVGSNNINLLQPIGQFGTRLQGGKDAASPRYIFTKLSPLTRLIFHPSDDPLMKAQYDDGSRIEPVWYMPIIPMVLVNGADGIGTGWMTKIPNHNPREIIDNLKRMIDGEEPHPMRPWYKHFKGEIEQLDDQQRFIVYGEVAVLDEDEGKVEITELPVGVWTQAYKENVLEPMSTTTDKTQAVIQDYKEYNTDTTVRFVVQMSPQKLRAAEAEGLHKFFKIQSSLTTTSMCLFDSEQCMVRYDTVTDILQDFYKLRLKFYVKRKAYLEGILQAEALKLSNQARFIIEKCDGRLVIENKKRKLMVEEMKRMKYDPDPVRAWKLRNNKDETIAAEEEARRNAADTEDSQESQDEPDEVEVLAADYDYLLSMVFWSVTAERKEEILKKRDNKLQELKTLQATPVPDLWRADLDALLVMLEKVEAKELKDENCAEIAAKAAKIKQQPGKRANAGPKKTALTDCLPSPMARRIAPKIDEDLRKKFRKAGPKGPKKPKVEAEELDEYDLLANREVKTLQARLGTSPSMIERAAAKIKSENKGPKLKQTKLNFGKADKKRKANSDSESDALSEIDRVDDVLPSVSRQVTKRTAAAKAKFVFDDTDESDDDDEPMRPVNGSKREDSDASDDFVPRKRKLSSDSEDSNKSPDNKPANQSSDAMFDSLVGLDKQNGGGSDAPVNISSSSDSSPIVKKAAPPKKKLMQNNDDAPPPKKAPAKKAEATKKPEASKKPAAAKKPSKPAPKRKNYSDSSNSDSEADWKTKTKKPVKKTKKKDTDSDDSDVNFVRDSPHNAATTGRQRKPVKYTLDDPTSSDDD